MCGARMMFNPLAQKTVKQVVQYLPANFAVIDLGNQTFVGENFTTKSFYESLGASSYLALDVNKKMDAMVCDLNEEIPFASTKFGYLRVGTDLVVNNGTSEHLFNQGTVFKNIHELCKLNGVMLHILPLTPWINHGFYNYNPIFFRDLARANSYKILFYWLGNRWSDVEDVTDNEKIFKEKNPTELLEIIQKIYGIAPIHKDIFNVVALQKTNSNSFEYPMQNKYIKDIEGEIKSK
jgi:hypothetical protein